MKWSELKLNSDGHLPVVVQDFETGVVLMVGYMNEESFLKTLETREMWYFSRSRQELWHKGATSGHIQKVMELWIDCDSDTLLAKVDQVGKSACHTGSVSCFFSPVILPAQKTDQK